MPMKRTTSASSGFTRSKRTNNFSTDIANKNNNHQVVSNAAKRLTNIQLSDEQAILKLNILHFAEHNLLINHTNKPSVFVINGDAGTGKSVILNSIFNETQRLSRTTEGQTLSGTKNYLVVNHPEMLKLYHQISKQFPFINKSDLERPTSLINKYSQSLEKPVDILIIDEAHLLATSKDSFKKFRQDNHLEELLKLAKVVILVFDDKQSLRMGSFWNLNKSHNGASLTDFLNCDSVYAYKTFNLTKQFRVVAEDDCLNWIKEISTTKKILPLPLDDLILHKFEFRIFKNCSTMYQHIQEKNKEVGQSRILATYDFPYRLDGKDYFVTSQSDEFKLRWDRYLPSITVPWSERDDTIEEVGSVYTIQGLDLNYAGIIMGRSIGYDKVNDSIKIKPEFYDDYAGFTRKKNILDINQVREKIILNSLNVLLTRGVKGLYIFAWDNELRERLLRDSDPRLVI